MARRKIRRGWRNRNRLSTIRVSRCALYALLIGAPVAEGAYRGWPLAGAELLALVGVVAWALEMLRARRLEWRRTALDLPLGLLVLFVLVQVALGNRPLVAWALAPPDARLDLPATFPTSLFALGTISPTQTARSLLLFLAYAAVYVLVVNLIRERCQLDRLIRTLLLLGAGLAFLALLDYLSGEPVFIWWRDRPLAGRLSGPFVNPDHFAAWLAMLVCLGLGYLAGRRSEGETVSPRTLLISREGRERLVRRYLPFAGVAVMGLALVFTLSRGGVVSLLGALVVLLGLLAGRGRARWSLFTVGALLAVTLAYSAWVGLGPFLARVRAGPLDYASRWTQTLTTIPMLAISPAFGVGLGAYKDIYFRYQPPALGAGRMYFPYAHNDLLQLAVELGLVGSAIVVFAAWRVGRDLVGAHLLGRGCCPVGTGERPARRRDPFSVGVGLGALGGVVALTFDSVFDFAARIPANGILAAACLGIATVALHTRFGAGEELLTRVSAVSLEGRRWLLLGTGMAVVAVSVILVPAMVRPALVEAELEAAGGGDRHAAVDEALVLDSRDPGALAARAGLAWTDAEQVRATGLTPIGQVAGSREERQRAALALLDAAIRDFRAALALTPSDPFLHEQLAWAHGTIGLIEPSRTSAATAAAVAHFRRAIALAPGNPFLYRSLAAFAVTQPGALLGIGLHAGREAVEREPELLADLVDRFLPLDLGADQWTALVPGTALDRLRLADLLEARGRLDAADAVYRRAVALAAGGEEALCRWMRARLLMKANDYPDALTEIGAALGREPANPELHLTRAEALAREGDPTALEAFRTAVASAEARPDRSGRDALPFVVAAAGARSLVEERLDMQDVVSGVRYRRALALYLNDQGRWSEALPLWNAVVAAAPNDARASFSRGVALESLGARGAALEAYQKAVALDGSSVPVRLRLARRLWDSEQYFQAIDEWRAAASRDPDNVEAHLALARAYVRIKDRGAARREYQRVLELAPNNPAARQELAGLTEGSQDSPAASGR